MVLVSEEQKVMESERELQRLQQELHSVSTESRHLTE